MEHKVDEGFEMNGAKYVTCHSDKDGFRCHDCALDKERCTDEEIMESTGPCGSYEREDGKNVIFKKVE